MAQVDLIEMDGGFSDQGVWTYTDTYQVVTDIGDSQVDVLAAVAGTYGAIYGPDPTCYLHSKNANRTAYTQNESVWEVTLSWQQGQPENSIAPWERPPVVTWGTSVYQTEVFETVNGKAIVNRAGDPWDDQTLKDDSRIEFSVQRNSLTFNGYLYWLYRDCVNSVPFQGVPPKTVKMAGIRANLVQDDTWGSYWDKQITFQVNPAGWMLRKLNTGVREKRDGKLFHIVGDDHKPISEPVCLDKFGKVLPIGQPGIFLDFEVYNAVDLNQLI